MTHLHLVSFALVFSVVAGCQQSSDRAAAEPRTPQPLPAKYLPDRETAVSAQSPAGMVSASRVASATDSIVEARCAREHRCENVGAGKRHATLEECYSTVRDDWEAELRGRECFDGTLNQEQLSACVTEVRNDDCRNPFGTLARVAACTADQICSRPGAPR